MRFTGTVTAKLDAKGRVFFPASFRKLVEGENDFVLRRDVYQPCLVIYPVTVWEEEVRLLRAHINRWNPQEAMVFRQFLADAETLALDASGRFLLNKRMLQIADIDKDIAFIGMDDRIEIWSKEKVEEPFLPAREFGEALQNLMAPQSSTSIIDP